MTTYLIAVKRSKRQQLSLQQAVDGIGDIAGVKIVGDLASGMARVVANERAIAEVVRRLSPWCHIETLIQHTPQVGRRAR
jgi:hypothetical protein